MRALLFKVAKLSLNQGTMRFVIFVLIAAAVFVFLAFAALWVWGTIAFTPKRVSVGLVLQGDLDHGALYQIIASGEAFQAPAYTAVFGTQELGPRFTGVFAAAGGPIPRAVRRVDEFRVEVVFDRPLAAGAETLMLAVGTDGVPSETATIAADGSVTRAGAPWLTGLGGEAVP